MNNPKSKIQNSKLLSVSACAALTLLVLFLTLMPGDLAPSGLGWDKLNHAAAIGAVTAAAFFALRNRRHAGLDAFLYGTFLAMLIEILQWALTTSRTAEWGDLVAGMVGAGCVQGVIYIFNRGART